MIDLRFMRLPHGDGLPLPAYATAGAAGLRVLGWLPGLRKVASLGSAVFGGPMTTYTAVLLTNTAVPAWHESHESMPFLFAGSGMAAGGGLTMALTPVDEAGPAQKVALAGAAIELIAAAQGVDYHAPLRTSAALQDVHARIRALSPHLQTDRYWAGEMAALQAAVLAGDMAGDLLL